MPFDGSLLLELATVLIAAGAVYGGIRSDLKLMHERINHAERVANKAHDRIDGMANIGRRAGE